MNKVASTQKRCLKCNGVLEQDVVTDESENCSYLTLMLDGQDYSFIIFISKQVSLRTKEMFKDTLALMIDINSPDLSYFLT